MMEDLMVKYIKEINEFKNNMQKKYQFENKRVQFTIQSYYTWLGEVLEISTNLGDKMTILEEDENPISYQYNEIVKIDKQLDVIITESRKDQFTYTGTIYHSECGYFVNYRRRKIYAESVDQLIKDLDEEDLLDECFNMHFNEDKSHSQYYIKVKDVLCD